MGARCFEELIAWQLARELENEAFAFTATRPAAFDIKYCNQIRESTPSARRNTAEGFGRFYPKEFIRFLRIAAGSLHETKDHLHEALDRHYLPEPEHRRLVRLAIRAIKANSSLIRYLERSTPPKRTTPEEPPASNEPPEPNER